MMQGGGVFLAILSPGYFESKWCMAEMRAFLKLWTEIDKKVARARFFDILVFVSSFNRLIKDAAMIIDLFIILFLLIVIKYTATDQHSNQAHFCMRCVFD